MDKGMNGSSNRKKRSRESSAAIDTPTEETAPVEVSEADMLGRPEIVSLFVKLEEIPRTSSRTSPLEKSEIEELERVLEFSEDEDTWRADWSGNLAYLDKKIPNPKANEKTSFRQTLLQWSHKIPGHLKYVRNLCRYVALLKATPRTAKEILLHTIQSESVEEVEKGYRRVLFDPKVLKADGWTTERSAERVGASGGPALIGDKIVWDGSEAVVIAYDHDGDIGDLWKALWIDDDQRLTFDLEAEEILEAKRKWSRRVERREKKATPLKSETPVIDRSSFDVKGIEYGVILACSYSRGARPGVFWPARVMHASEVSLAAKGSKRASAKQRLDVVFFSPYWNSVEASPANRKVSSLADANLRAGPLFQVETIEASNESIQEYTWDSGTGLNISELRTAFRFTGLPKSLFASFVDAHRLAMSYKEYARSHLDTTITASDRASASLFESHPMAVQVPCFPHVVLELPLAYVLSRLPQRKLHQSSVGSESDEMEPLIQLGSIVKSLEPPHSCSTGNAPTPSTTSRKDHVDTPIHLVRNLNASFTHSAGNITIDRFIEGLPALQNLFSSKNKTSVLLSPILSMFQCILKTLPNGADPQTDSRRSCFVAWVRLKRMGEDTFRGEDEAAVQVTTEWNRAMERLYKFVVSASVKTNGNTKNTCIRSDERCNSHLTSIECFERPVRLPAAMKGARLASSGSIHFDLTTMEKYLSYTEDTLLQRAHATSYLDRMKSRCNTARSGGEVVALTEDSEGGGGEDTMGSRDSWNAAIACVATAVAAVDDVMTGSYVNAFCITRPPGHHAGRFLHPMKAVSNGFCILNAVACAAIHATANPNDGGLGLSRVCVVDFDVHHGNGTQDILCSTYDPRYLYISTHAGGVEVNGRPPSDDDLELHHPKKSKRGGIYPGHCGDSSPHSGVVNVPLGETVTSHGVGAALLGRVGPAITNFMPELIIISAGFDAHKSDPMGLGGLTAADFASITEFICELALKHCSGRVVSVLEGGYGVPCCRTQKDLFLPMAGGGDTAEQKARPQPSKLLDLDLPDSMDDQVPYALQRRLEKCHEEGFVECVREHVASLAKCNKRD